MKTHTYRSTAALPPVVLPDESAHEEMDSSIHIPVLQDPLPDSVEEHTTNRLRNSGYAIGLIVFTAVVLVIGVQSVDFATAMVQ